MKFIWPFIWIMAIIILIDLLFLRLAPEPVTVISAKLEKAGRNDICILWLKTNLSRSDKSVDESICYSVKAGDVLILSQTILLRRWVDLKDNNDKSIAFLIENRILTDIAFILLAFALPLFFRRNPSGKILIVAYTLFLVEIYAVMYFALTISRNL